MNRLDDHLLVTVVNRVDFKGGRLVIDPRECASTDASSAGSTLNQASCILAEVL